MTTRRPGIARTSLLPEWRREGWRPAGPGQCRCPDCGTAVSTNAFARATHKRVCKGDESPAATMEDRK
jgi:hypothetical protein